MSKCVTGSISKDFPLYHSTIIPTYESPDKHSYKHKRAKNRDIFTNEHPDIFRLEGMKEGGYVNPFLDKVIKVDRSEYLKKLSTDRKNVNFIDFIKSNRKYSQDPKIIRYISSDANTELKHKRMGKTNISTELGEISDRNSKISLNKNILLTNNNANTTRKKYNSLLRKLNYFLPKIDYRIKRTLDIDKNNPENSMNSSNLSIDFENDNLYKKIATGIDTKTNSNLRNMNAFEFDLLNKKLNKNDDDFKFQRKQIYQYNPIKDRMETIVPPPYKNPRWSSFLENYFLMMNSQKQFQRKGGLLSEFSNKNIGSINNNKFDIQQRLKKEKEEKSKSKERKKSINK